MEQHCDTDYQKGDSGGEHDCRFGVLTLSLFFTELPSRTSQRCRRVPGNHHRSRGSAGIIVMQVPFLLDENIAAPLADKLDKAGHDVDRVVDVSEMSRSII